MPEPGVVPAGVAEIRAGLDEVVGTERQRVLAARGLPTSVIDDDDVLFGRRDGGE